jgi:hypothetical protein
MTIKTVRAFNGLSLSYKVCSQAGLVLLSLLGWTWLPG